MRTSRAISPRKGSRVRRRTEASTPRLCNSSTTRSRQFRLNPFFAKYQPPAASPPRVITVVRRRKECQSRTAAGWRTRPRCNRGRGGDSRSKVEGMVTRTRRNGESKDAGGGTEYWGDGVLAEALKRWIVNR